MNRFLAKPIAQILCLLAVLVAVHVVNVLCGMWFTHFGVIPRSVVGLRGILFMPLLHANWGHLIANTAPLGVMLGLVAFSRGRLFWPITAAIWIGSGIAVWLVGRPGSVQVGASGLIYGLAAFLLVTAWYRRDLRSAAAAIFVIVLYGGIAWGLFPIREGVSWEGHAGGAVAGFLVAWQSTRRLSTARTKRVN